MKKLLIASLVTTIFFASSTSCNTYFNEAVSDFNIQEVQLYADSGDVAAGAAAGLVGGALLTGAMSGGSRRSAREEAERVSREREADQMKRQMELQQYSQQTGMETKMNMLILALVILFIGIVVMSIMLIRKNTGGGQK